ncbi:putative tail sheath protein [uncultured phage cr123_1]|uniref:Tail sheath protein n=1 Tax=uncultured phage cr123_1 TaxID=2986401 RepID=A0AAE7RV33_9CAUD|nr:putative tail sheath protein [uncultured phage cr123_1]QWM89265.1 putative tail sheath protein [uncultured phage cr123_1]
MRQFLLGKSVAYPTALTSLAVGQLAFVALVSGVETLDSDGTKIKDKGYIYLGKSDAKGGKLVVPIYKNNFSYSKMDYAASTQYTGNFTIADVVAGSDYTVVVVKKGVGFNERNKWTATVRAKAADTVDTIAAALASQITANVGAGVTAAASAGKVTVTAKEKGVDYELTLGDDLFGTAVTQTHTTAAVADAKYITDLAIKAAADAGIEYTYQDAGELIYPDFPLNPLAQDDSADTGFTVYTIRFAEPREMKTVDQSINQIVQIAVPTGAAAIATIDKILAALAA